MKTFSSGGCVGFSFVAEMRMRPAGKLVAQIRMMEAIVMNLEQRVSIVSRDEASQNS